MKKINLILYTFILLLFITQNTLAQSTPSVTLPSIIPPPADAATLGQYGNIPVTLFNGLANISIPLYEIKTPRLTVPITLDYYPSGIKVDQMASWVGLGWSLNAGGVITRTIRGLDDFESKGFYYSDIPKASEVTAANSWNFFANTIYKSQDAEPDFFFYNFLSNSGKFVFDDDKKPVIINYQNPMQIQYSQSSNSFILRDDKGNSYYFNDQEHTQSGDYHGSYSPTYISSWYLSKIVSSDRSDTINFRYFADNQLEQDFLSYEEVIGPTIEWKNCGACLGGWAEDDNTDVDDNHNTPVGEPYIKSSPLRLSEIDFKKGKISFYSTADRLDATGVKLDSIVVSKYDYDAHQYAAIKKIDLSYTYFTTNLSDEPIINNNPYRLKLDSVRFYGQDYSYGKIYKFGYNSNIMLPWIGSLAKDLFGYFNGEINNNSLVPSQTVNFTDGTYNVGGANRNVNPDSIQAGMLTRIYYPTGGYTAFDYEPNSYHNVQEVVNTISKSALATGQMIEDDTTTFVAPITEQADLAVNISPYSGTVRTPFVSLKNLTTSETLFTSHPGESDGYSYDGGVNLVQGNQYQLVAGAYDDGHIHSGISVSWEDPDSQQVASYGGGLRIKKVTDFGNTGKSLKATLYKYGVDECGYGYLASPTYLLDVNSYNRIFDNGTAGYQTCIGTASTTRRIFTGSSLYDLFGLTGSPVSYTQVTKYEIDSLSNNIGKTVFNYSYRQNSVMPASQSYNEALYVTNDGWSGGQLLSSVDYSYKNDTYWPVKKIVYDYNSIPLDTGRGLKIGLARQYASLPALFDSTTMANGCFYMAYYYFDYPIYTGTVLPSSRTIYTYNTDDTTKYVLSSKHFTYYNSDDLQPSVISDNTSDGRSLTTINRYPEEADSIEGLIPSQVVAIDSMISRHNITTLLQSQTYRGSTPVSLMKNDYSIWNSNLILLDSIQFQNGTFPIEKRIQFLNYDNNGNILTDAKSDDVLHSYLWDYSGSYPIAEVVNAYQSDIAYTSFEADGKGNWTFSGPPSPTDEGITGKMAYSLGAGSISKSGLTSSKKHIISYWLHSGGNASITGGTQSNSLTGKTVGNWTYHEVTITGTSSLTISGSGYIDELRLYPADAQMTTYTYNPLIGTTSQCGADNIIQYYEYDGLGRLQDIKDEDGNIIKTFEYHFKQ